MIIGRLRSTENPCWQTERLIECNFFKNLEFAYLISDQQFTLIFLVEVFEYIASKNKPLNTIIVPNHCLIDKELPKIKTDPKTVKNFRVVVITEHGSGPNSETIRKMKVCPMAPVSANVNILVKTYGCL